MRKEVILSILIGVSLGLIITYGFYLSYSTKQSKTTSTELVNTEITPSPEASNPNQLMLSSPEDEIIYQEKKIRVAGTTLANSFVIIFVGNQENITQSDQSGNFSIEVALESGSNIITVCAIDEDGQTSKIERTVIVYSHSLENNETAVNAEKASDSAKNN